MPSPQEIARFYPDRYWWSASRTGTLNTAESVYRRLALRDHIGFTLRAARNSGGDRLLDVGCGSGTLLGLLKSRGLRVVGLDFSNEAARVANSENGVHVIVGSLDHAAFPEASFDVVTMFHVLEHVTNPRAVLAEAFRILKPSGRLALQVPSVDSWQFKVCGSKWSGLDIPRHVIDYSKAAVLKLLGDSGFVAQHIRHFNLRDNAPALVSSLFPSLDPGRRAVLNRQRDNRESAPVGWARHLAYLLLVIAAQPAAIVEAAAGHGATIMIEASKG